MEAGAAKRIYPHKREWWEVMMMIPRLARGLRRAGQMKYRGPVGVLLWAFVSDEVEGRLAQGITKLRPQDWKSGDKLWIVEAIAPFGGAEEMVKDLKAKVFAGRELRYVTVGEGGRKDVRVA